MKRHLPLLLLAVLLGSPVPPAAAQPAARPKRVALVALPTTTETRTSRYRAFAGSRRAASAGE
jgi:hypothetical protein